MYVGTTAGVLDRARAATQPRRGRDEELGQGSRDGLHARSGSVMQELKLVLDGCRRDPRATARLLLTCPVT
jgi:hypothetical protein